MAKTIVRLWKKPWMPSDRISQSACPAGKDPRGLGREAWAAPGPVPLWLAPKLALYLAMRDQQVNHSELARRLGVHERVIRRMLDSEHALKAEKTQTALALWAKRMTVEVRDAA
jgi:hypothetical protein